MIMTFDHNWCTVKFRKKALNPFYIFQTLMDRRIKPWVNKKIVEYIGEEEPSLTDFICQKVMAHSVPSIILNDVAMVSYY